MFTIKLLSNTKDTVSYEVWNGDTDQKINEITVDKNTKSYKLQKGNKVSNSYEAGAYRAIIDLLKSNTLFDEYSNGWI